MAISHITIVKFAYLKTPKFGGTVHSVEGGSSNLSECKTLKAMASQIWFRYAQPRAVEPSTRIVIETWEGFDAKDEPVMTTVQTDVDALLSRLCITRPAVR
jgi:hypothetical protein